MKKLAGIVTYNPDLLRLKENISAVLTQVDLLVICDNGSANISDLMSLISDEEFKKVEVIQNQDNIGIAAALNQICEWALNAKGSWVLTLDQDSVVPDCILSEYVKYINLPNVGLLTCRIQDVNMGVVSEGGTRVYDETSMCITSASFISLEAWKKVGRFCEEMFIDSVDFDMCLSMTDAGYKIYRINSVCLLHEIGHGRVVHFRGKNELVFNHSPLRCYYMIRNTIYMGNRHNRKQYGWRLAIKRFILINLYESQRAKKDCMMILGVFHAMRSRYGKY